MSITKDKENKPWNPYLLMEGTHHLQRTHQTLAPKDDFIPGAGKQGLPKQDTTSYGECAPTVAKRRRNATHVAGDDPPPREIHPVRWSRFRDGLMHMERVFERGRGHACKSCRGGQDKMQKVKEVEGTERRAFGMEACSQGL